MQIKNKETIILAKQRPLRNLTKGTHKDSGRNNHGRLTVRHQGGGVKQLYRDID
jgi:large subunit ribosomal protein L2